MRGGYRIRRQQNDERPPEAQDEVSSRRIAVKDALSALLSIREDASDSEDVRVPKQVLVFMAALTFPVASTLWALSMLSVGLRHR
jgi:hypothetical protein